MELYRSYGTSLGVRGVGCKVKKSDWCTHRGTLYDAMQFVYDNNKKDESESVVAQNQKVTFS